MHLFRQLRKTRHLTLLCCWGAISLLAPSQIDAIGAKPSPYSGAQDAFSGATNPALAVFVGDRIDPCARFYFNPKHGTIKNNARGLNVSSDANRGKQYFIAEGAVNKTFKMPICHVDWECAIGFATYIDIWAMVGYDKPFPFFGNANLRSNAFSRTYSTFFAVKVNEAHSIGVSIDVLQRRTSEHGRQFIDTVDSSVAPGFVTNRGTSHIFGVAPLFGWHWKISEKLQFGAVYRPKIYMSRYHEYKGLFPQLGSSDVPQRLGLGFSYRFTEKFSAAAECEWANNRNVQAHYPLLNSEGGINKLGSPKGPFHGYRDGYRILIGFGYSISDVWKVRWGYVHATRIIPRSQTAINFTPLVTITDYALANLTCNWGKSEISVLYSHGFKNKIRGRHSIPASLGGGEADISESSDSLAMNWGYKF